MCAEEGGFLGDAGELVAKTGKFKSVRSRSGRVEVHQGILREQLGGGVEDPTFDGVLGPAGIQEGVGRDAEGRRKGILSG